MSDNNPFNIINDQKPANTGQPVEEKNTEQDINARCEGLVKSSPVFLFMKGVPEMPQCGFSANVVAILNHLGVEFKSFDVLSDMDIRQGIKEYANWPTFPQLWVKGKLVGGNDIITEMFESGDLKEVLNQ